MGTLNFNYWLAASHEGDSLCEGEKEHGLNHSALLIAHGGVAVEADCAK